MLKPNRVRKQPEYREIFCKTSRELFQDKHRIVAEIWDSVSVNAVLDKSNNKKTQTEMLSLNYVQEKISEIKFLCCR